MFVPFMNALAVRRIMETPLITIRELLTSILFQSQKFAKNLIRCHLHKYKISEGCQRKTSAVIKTLTYTKFFINQYWKFQWHQVLWSDEAKIEQVTNTRGVIDVKTNSHFVRTPSSRWLMVVDVVEQLFCRRPSQDNLLQLMVSWIPSSINRQ